MFRDSQLRYCRETHYVTVSNHLSRRKYYYSTSRGHYLTVAIRNPHKHHTWRRFAEIPVQPSLLHQRP